MYPRLALCALVCLMSAWSDQAFAQLIQNAPGTTGGLFGGGGPVDAGRTRQLWTVTADVSGGRDREPIQVPGGGLASGRTASTGAASTRYWRGRTGTFFEAQGGGFITRQSLSSQDLRAADGSARFAKAFGLRSGIGAALSASYQPLEILDLLGTSGEAPLLEGASVPTDVSPQNGVQQQRLIATAVSADGFRNWTPRQRLEASVTSWRWRPSAGSGPDIQAETVVAREWWNYQPRAALFGAYTFNRNYRSEVSGFRGSGLVHAAELGWRVERRSTPRRSVVFQAQGGVARVSAEPSTAAASTEWQMVGSGVLQANVSQNWMVLVRGSREVSALNGVSAEPFVTDQASVQLGGTLFRRLGVGLFGAYSHGESAGNASGSFEGSTLTGRLQYGLARWCGLFASYNYYDHRVTQVVVGLPGFPNTFERHVTRVGLTLWLPMYGAF